MVRNPETFIDEGKRFSFKNSMHFQKTNRFVASVSIITYCIGVLSAPYVKTVFDETVFNSSGTSIESQIIQSGGSVKDLGRLNEAF